jgi:hypothetical protein
MLDFATALPGLRRQIAKDLLAAGLPRRKVIAAVVQLLEKTLIRVGNDEYARNNNSYLREITGEDFTPNPDFRQMETAVLVWFQRLQRDVQRRTA